MNPDTYCADLVLQRGSSLHYALVYLPAAPRATLCALFALRRELRDNINASSDPSIAQARLAWWRDEIDRLVLGQPAHPVTQALANHASAWIGAEGSSLKQLCDAVAIELRQTRFVDGASLDQLLAHDHGTLFSLCARALGLVDAAQREAARQIGVGYALSELIAHVGADARAGRIYLPVNELEAFAVPAADILGARPSAGLHQLLAQRAQAARQHLAEARAALGTPALRVLRPLQILVTLSTRRLAECEREQFRVLEHRLELTPLRSTLIGAGVWLGLVRAL